MKYEKNYSDFFFFLNRRTSMWTQQPSVMDRTQIQTVILNNNNNKKQSQIDAGVLQRFD